MEGFFDDLKDKIIANGRVEEMRQIAKEQKFNFQSRQNFANQDYLLKSFNIFKGKKDKRFKGILRKKDNELDALIRIYDYFYFGEFKKKKTTIFEINCSNLDLPKFAIQPKGILKQVSSFFVNKEKPYAEDAELHSKFDIETVDPASFENAISTKFLDFLFTQKNISVEGEGDYLLVYFLGTLIPAKAISSHYEDVLDLLEIILNDDSNEFV